MRIDIYSTFLPDIPVEKNEWNGDTFAGFLDENEIEWRERESLPIVVKIDDVEVPPEAWENALAPEAVVSVFVTPGGGVFKSIGSIIGKIFNAVFGWMMPKTDSSSYNSPEQGKQLQTVDAKANQARLGQVVPEIAGRHIRYPDYLVPPRRYFQDKRYQWVKFLACVGVGSYYIDLNDVKVGDTPLNQLAGDAAFSLYPPNFNLGGVEEAAEHWHTTEEVGATSSGTAGLVLSTEIANRENSDPAAYNFDWDWISRPGSDWPAGWGAGTQVQVEYPRTYEVNTITVPGTEFDPSYQISEISGYLAHVPNLSPGSQIALGPFGDWEIYRIRAITDMGSGEYTFRLERRTPDASDEYPPIVITPGTRTLIFGANVARSILSFESEALSVGPGGFETGEVSVSGARVRYSGGAVYGEWSSEFVAVPGNETTQIIEWDVFFPNGLAYVEDDGDLSARTVSTEIQYRDVNSPLRTTVTRTYTEATLDQIGFTERINIPAMRPAVRMRRVGAESTSTQVQDKCHWYGLKAHLLTRFIYPNWTTIAVALRSGGRLAAQSENQINLIAERQLPQLNPDNTWTEPQATRQISAFFRYILTTIGYTDDQIDMEELQRLHSIWFTRGETLDYVFDETTVKEALQLAVAAGMGEVTVSDGKVRPIREGVRTVFEQAYSPQNMTAPLRREFTARLPEDADGVEVEFMNPNTWTKDVVRCGLPGDAFTKVEKMTARGVLDGVRAWRIGMRRRRQMRYRRWSYSFGTELDALNSEYKSYVPLFADIPGYGQSALIEDISPAPGGSARVRLSEKMRWEEGQSHIFGYRKPDGTFSGSFPAERGSDDYEVIVPLPQPWPEVTLKMELPHAYFGVSERFCFPAWITDIAPRGNNAVSVKAENYDDREYASDDEFPPT